MKQTHEQVSTTAYDTNIEHTSNGGQTRATMTAVGTARPISAYHGSGNVKKTSDIASGAPI